MQPIIYTVSADGTHIHSPSAMSEVTDSDGIDFQGMAETVANKVSKPMEAGDSMVRQLWTELMEDIFPKRGSTRA